MSDRNKKNPTKSKLPLVLSLVVFGIVVLLYFVWPGFNNFLNEAYTVLTSGDNNRISNWVSQYGFWAPFVILLLMIVQMFLFVIPSALIMIVCVLAYGPIWGSLLSLLGIFIASTLAYWIAHYVGSSAIESLIGPKSAKKISFYVKNYGFWAVIVARISPLLSNDGISFVAGLVKMGYRKFISATFLGILPLILAIGWFGQDFHKLKTGLIWISGFSLLSLLAYIGWDKKNQSRG
ncbi:TVP38/TMEM64 family protein [Aegicerativicinus sediminis]|uniref:TVP38/TMEM64 family protein n=1 Tax=Aegicerativicinus sediminis TaxID=2893202 RepID=UPI001E2955C4|nr:TVP38/TMEM64 family protein [Aegicerativicinus sediminis]